MWPPLRSVRAVDVLRGEVIGGDIGKGHCRANAGPAANLVALKDRIHVEADGIEPRDGLTALI